MASVVATSILTVRPGHDDEFVAQWRELADWIVAAFFHCFSPGARPPSLNRDLDNRSRFLAVEEWDSLESVMRCRRHPEFQRRVGALLGGPAASMEAATVEAVVSPAERRDALPRTPEVSSYRGPQSSPWAVPLPKTGGEARSLGEGPLVGVEKPLTTESFLHHLVGVWVLRTVDPANQNVDGVAIDPDSRWTALFESEGELHRSNGWGSEGTWTALDTSGMNGRPTFQLNMTVDGGGVGLGFVPPGGHPTFATSLPVMRVQGRMGNVEYVKLDQLTP